MTERTPHSAAWRAAAPTDHRLVRTARGLRVFAVLVGVAVVSGRASARGRPRR